MTRRTQIAAAVVLAFLGTMGILAWTGKGGGKVAMADVVRHVSQTRTVTFTVPGNGRFMVRSPGLVRYESEDGTVVSVTDPQTGEAQAIDHRQRQVITIHMVERPFDLYGLFRNFRNGTERAVGQKELDGRKLSGFQITQALGGKDAHLTLWVDPQTRLPVQIEWREGPERQAELLTDIAFDVPLSDELFSLAVPEGYTRQEMGGLSAGAAPEPERPGDAGLTVTPLEGMGGVPFGAGRDQVIAAFGQPDRIDANGADLQYFSKGFSVGVFPKAGMRTLNCYTKAAFAGHFRVNDFAGQTDRGIRMGSTREQVVSAYGEPDKTTRAGQFTYLEYEGLKTTFTLDSQGRVVQFMLLGARPAGGQ